MENRIRSTMNTLKCGGPSQMSQPSRKSRVRLPSYRETALRSNSTFSNGTVSIRGKSHYLAFVFVEEET